MLLGCGSQSLLNEVKYSNEIKNEISILEHEISRNPF